MQPKELKQAIQKIKMWQRGGERAPHKPLLLLYTLGRLTRNEPCQMFYAEVKDDLIGLLNEFGPARQKQEPIYPFIRLSNDRLPKSDTGFWQVQSLEKLNTTKNWSDRELINNQTSAGFTEPVYDMLKKDTNLVQKIAVALLYKIFPDTMHEDIFNQVGLDIDFSGSSSDLITQPKRNPEFCKRDLMAYEYRCAVCNLDDRFGDTLIAVEAAYIKWHRFSGPDNEQNGIALCTLHHKLFDRGVFKLNDDMSFQVAENAHGTHGMDEWLVRYHGQEGRKPQSPDHYPCNNYINWHVREVFRGPARFMDN